MSPFQKYLTTLRDVLSISCLLVLFILENGLLKHCLTQCSIQQAFGGSSPALKPFDSHFYRLDQLYYFTQTRNSSHSPGCCGWWGAASALWILMPWGLLAGSPVSPPTESVLLCTACSPECRCCWGTVPVITLKSPNHHRWQGKGGGRSGEWEIKEKRVSEECIKENMLNI